MKKIIGAFILVTVAASSLMGWDVNADKIEKDKILKRWKFPTTWTEIPQSKGQTPGPTPAQPMQQPQGPEPATSAVPQKKYENIIVMFTKEACPYCQYMMPIMKEIERKYGDVIGFIYADIDKNPQYPSVYRFSTVPHIAYYKNDQQVHTHGSNEKTITVEQIEDKIRSFGMGQKQ